MWPHALTTACLLQILSLADSTSVEDIDNQIAHTSPSARQRSVLLDRARKAMEGFRHRMKDYRATRSYRNSYGPSDDDSDSDSYRSSKRRNRGRSGRRSAGAYGVGGDDDEFEEEESNDIETETSRKPAREQNSKGKRDVIAGIPDNSDSCFARYANVIVVNAQPYERRSRMELPECKSTCAVSQGAVYSCAAFVYDNVNRVCDIFAHAGDRAPARLLKFQTRDYFEPRFEEADCDLGALQPTTTTLPPPIIAQASSTDERDLNSINSPSKLLPSPPPLSTPPPTLLPSSEIDALAPQGTQCGPGKIPRFLKTEGFELYKSDDHLMQGVTETQCLDACEKNEVDGSPFSCRSLDFSSAGICALSPEAAVPLGNGQLKQNTESGYFEKLCLAEATAEGCDRIFSRFPQMILVGFAETVTDSSTFEDCFERCLNSFALYGFNCTSGMYYFEEAQLNCILNTENRKTQSELFAEENTDIVDYFEIACGGGISSMQKRAKARAAKILGPSGGRSQNLVLAPRTNTAWSPCEGGRQHRRIDCLPGTDDDDSCGLESRMCTEEEHKDHSPSQRATSPAWKSMETTSPAPLKLLDRRGVHTGESSIKLKKGMLERMSTAFKCPPGRCCAVFGGCDVGLRQNPESKRLEWCRTPCEGRQLRGRTQ